jgi:hypothetical protein
MNPEQMKVAATAVITQGFAEKATDDEMKQAMFSQGIPFSKLNPLFKQLSIELGFVVSPAVVTAGIKESMVGCAWDACTTAEHVEAFANQIMAAIPGSTRMRVMQLVKPYTKSLGLTLPEPPAAVGGTRNKVGPVASAAVEYFNSTEAPTKEGMFNAIRPHVAKHTNAVANTKLYFNVLWAAVNRIALIDASKVTAEMVLPVEVVEAAPAVVAQVVDPAVVASVEQAVPVTATDEVMQ